MKVKRKDVLSIIKATFPEYNGRKISVEAAENVWFYNLNWCDGTKYAYKACTVLGESIPARVGMDGPPPWDNPTEMKECAVPVGVVIVRHSIFMGMDGGLIIYVNPSNMPKFLEGK